MGIRFRKSIQFGPLRINLSKSGIGWSVGGKGARFTKKAGGGYRTTVGVPGTGVSYVKDHTGEQSKSAQKPEQRPYRTQALQDMETAEDTAARGGKYEPSRKDPGKKRGRKPRIALFIVILLVIYGGFQLLKNEISTGDTVQFYDATGYVTLTYRASSTDSTGTQKGPAWCEGRSTYSTRIVPAGTGFWVKAANDISVSF